MNDAEVNEASGWWPGEDGHYGFMSGLEYAAKRARQRGDAYLKESLSGQVSKSYYLRERARALLQFAVELEGVDQ